MNRGELLTRLTVWLALCAYAIAAAMMLLANRRSSWIALARWVWTCGCALFIMHVVCAFAYYHGWSHAAAYRDTARQTAEMTGFHWGGGLYLNYLFAVAWLADALWWWLAAGAFARRSARLTAALHAFLFFMVFNGAVIFASASVRLLGAFICMGLVVLWLLTRRNRVHVHHL